MALSSFSPSITPSSRPSFYYLLLQSQTHFSYVPKNLRFKISCSNPTIEFETRKPHRVKVNFDVTKKMRKPRPSFLDQINDKWSTKITSSREKFPWQEQQREVEEEEGEEKAEKSSRDCVTESDIDSNASTSDPVSVSSLTRSISAPWAHGSQSRKPQVDSKSETLGLVGKHFDGISENSDNDVTNGVTQVKHYDKLNEISVSVLKNEGKVNLEGVTGVTANEILVNLEGVTGVTANEILSRVDENFDKFVGSCEKISGSVELPWKREKRMVEREDGKNCKESNTELAEKMIPEHELKRLRNVALRMLERIKVGVSGITQDLVDTIHEKWKLDEVVKLKFEGALSLNMKRTHEILESKTGGLVIWRSGTSVVLYRGMGYNLPCVQSYRTNTNVLDNSKDVARNVIHEIGVNRTVETTNSGVPGTSSYPKNLSKKELMELADLNYLLDELGPRFKDWSGCEPLPVDADLLPSVVPGYKPPLRLLPYGVKPCLKNREMTMFRRLARATPPHFALGRNRELQGLAKAMVKLWERSVISKIAIKRGVENTRNEGMAEELKRLTRGTLLSRNKEFIVFYRGNDFLPPNVLDVLEGRKKELINLRQDEEEQARKIASASLESNAKASKVPLLAGTLTETMAATTRWGSQPSSEDVQRMITDSAFLKHASLVRHLEKKLVLAKGKLKKAEKALAKVQNNLEPANLPTDLETISDEERFLFHKIGLSMKPYLLLGRRGVYDGTIENVHLHWKFREVVKVIVRGKSLQQVKHIAISLESESGGVLVSLDKTTKGYAVIVYRGKNYLRPDAIRPKNLLTKRQALARSVELQRREALKHHIVDLEERIELVKSELEDMRNGRIIDTTKTLNSTMDVPYLSDDE